MKKLQEKNRRPKGVTPRARLSTLKDVTPPETVIVAVCGPEEKSQRMFAAAERTAKERLRVLDYNELFLSHIDRIGGGEKEPEGMEMRLLEAILDYPVTKLASGLAHNSIAALIFETISLASPYESVRKEAAEKISRAKNMLEILV